jgi:uncharacterized protein (TIGR00251 family)
MNHVKTDRGVVLNVYVRPDSREFKIEAEDDNLVAYCRESPTKGKVNKELVKKLSRLFKRRVEIVAGFTSKQKRILIADISIEDVNKILHSNKL